MTAPAAGHADVAAVGFGQRLDDCQSDAGASPPTVAGRVGAIEALEDVGQMLGGDAVAIVSHGENDFAGDVGDREGDVPAGGGVAQCVVEQVSQHLRQPLPIRPEPDRAAGVGAQGDVLGGIAVGDRGADGSCDLPGVDPPRGDGGVGVFGLGQGGGVGGEADQPTGLLAQHRDGRLVEAFHAVFHGFQVGLQHRHGRADFVGEVAEQLAAG